MKSKFRAARLGLLVLVIASSVRGQTPTPPTGQPPAPGLRKLTGDDARRAEELDKAIEAALKADRWDEAIAKARGTARVADAGPGAEALRDGERGMASQDVAPGGPDAA